MAQAMLSECSPGNYGPEKIITKKECNFLLKNIAMQIVSRAYIAVFYTIDMRFRNSLKIAHS